MTEYETLIKALKGNLNNGKGIHFLYNSKNDEYLSYNNLFKEACRYLSVYHELGLKIGDEVVLQYSSLHSLVIAYWGCILGGLIPIPLTLADKQITINKLFKVLTTLNKPWISTDSDELKTRLENHSLNNDTGKSFQVISSRLVNTNNFNGLQKSPKIIERAPNDTAFIQYSSGSTGHPKGVVLTHKNLLTNIYGFIDRFNIKKNDSFLNWMPMFHDFGMIFFHLAPIVLGVNQYIIPTNTFIINPVFWFKSINKYRTSILGSPNFGYKHFLKRFKHKTAEKENWDLSCVKVVINGAEPISTELAKEFYDELIKWGFPYGAIRPAYGLAEATLVVSGCTAKHEIISYTIDRKNISPGEKVRFIDSNSPDGLEVVNCGTPIDSTKVRITDNNRRPLGEGYMGNIELKGECITQGYYHNVEATRAAITEDGWLDTQDMGFVHNGNIVFIGRLKEMIIIGGVNYFPYDIENVILSQVGNDKQNHFIACGVPNTETGTEDLLIFVYYKKKAEGFLQIVRDVRRIILDEVGLKVAHVIPIKNIPKTTSGKVQRLNLAKRYKQGEFNEIIEILKNMESDNEDNISGKITISKLKTNSRYYELMDIIIPVIEDLLGYKDINIDTGFFDLGLTSMKLLVLHDHLEKKLGLDLQSTIGIDYPTIRKLVEFLATDPRDVIKSNDKDEKHGGYKEKHNSGDVAIVGMACRFPGGVDSPDVLFNLLSKAIDPVSNVPMGRWSNESFSQQQMVTTMGGYLNNIDKFDPLFFGISAKEAESLDPQHRILLELTWEALEDAGWDPKSLSDSKTGVFVGISNSDYQQVGFDLGHQIGPYTYTGSMHNSSAGRISYTFGFQGPCMAIDTACSSSLVAVNQGVIHLRSGSCNIALVSAVNLILNSNAHTSFSLLQALSPTGRCRSFDEGADGYIRSEGGAVLVLKRLEDAVEDRDSIWGVIRGSAVNHDGHSAGFTVPNGIAQKKVIEQALDNAGLTPDDIDYIEAHGSGTKLGDPQELNVLAEVFRNHTKPLLIGAVKSNLGHMETAAGMAGLCKVLLAMRYGAIPPNMHFNKGNPLIQWDKVPIRVVDKLTKWEGKNGVKRAGISSFSISGTNSHIIIESPPNLPISKKPEAVKDSYLITLSARTEDSLRQYINDLLLWLENPTADIQEVSQCLNITRTSLKHRLSFACTDIKSFKNNLKKLKNSSQPIGHEIKNKNSPVVFLFTGQGSHYHNMAQILYKESKTFREKFDELDRAFESKINISLTELIYGDNPQLLERPLFVQPLIFSIQVALGCLWESLGVKPDFIIGHSIGEYAAAYFDRIVSLKDAVNMVAVRAEIMDNTPQNGRMVGILSDESHVRELIKDYEDVSIAAINAPKNVTVSGGKASIDDLVKEARRLRVFVEELKVSHPFHSAVMIEGSKKLKTKLAGIKFNTPSRRFISTVTGDFLSQDEKVDENYWAKHLVQPVLFTNALERVVSAGATVFVEIGGKPILTGLVSQSYEDKNFMYLPSLRPKRSDWVQLNESIGRLWQNGYNINWFELHEKNPVRIKNFPHTPYDRKKVWYPQINDDKTSLSEVATTAQPAAIQPHLIQEVEIHHDYDVNHTKKEIKEIIAKITGVDIAEITDTVNLFSIGLDSLMITHIRKSIKDCYGVEISTAAFFIELQTLENIVTYIVGNMPSSENIVLASPTKNTEVTNSNKEDFKGSIPVNNSELHDIVRRQLSIMEEQLRLLKRDSKENNHINPKQRNSEVNIVSKRSINTEPSRQYKSVNNELSPVLNQQQQDFVDKFISRWIKRTRTSKEYTDEHRSRLSDWIANLNFDKNIKEIVYPVVSEKSKGSRFWDKDGNEYIDTAIGYGVSYFGHNPDFIVESIGEQLNKGYELGPQSALVGEVTDLISQITGVERVAYCNTGTEAVMTSLRLARFVTKRDKIVRFTNSYHGTFDGILGEVDGEHVKPISPGTPQSMVEDIVVLSYGIKESLEKIKSMGNELAAVLVEPVQSRNPSLQPKEFLQELRRLCTEYDITLIFDEILTGFRIHPGGAQAYFNIKADIVTYGKLIGGGMPIAVVAGKSKYLDALDGGSWSYHDDSEPLSLTAVFGGTYCKHPLSMAASRAVLLKIKEEGMKLSEETNARTQRFVERANRYFDEVKAPLKAVHFGSIYRFQPGVSTNMQSLSFELNLFFRLMMEAGVYVWERRVCLFSVAHTDEDVEKILDAIAYSVEALRKGGFEFLKIGEPPLSPKKDKYFDITSEEKRVYILSKLEGGDKAYQISAKFQIDGELEYHKLKNSFEKIIENHEILRCSFHIQDKNIVHSISDSIEQDCIKIDFRSEYGEEKFNRFWHRSFELSKAPLWRWALVTDKSGDYKLYLCIHHIIGDGESFNIIMQDLEACFNGVPLNKPTLPYRRYAEKSKEYLESHEISKSRKWWTNQLTPLPPNLNLPQDTLRPAINTFSGGCKFFTLETDRLSQIKELAKKSQSTVFLTLLSIWTAYLARIAQQADFCIGFPIDRRGTGDYSNTIGMFAQTIALRVKPDPNLKFYDYLNTVKETCYESYRHSSYPLDLMMQDLNVPRDMSRNPIFDVMFNYEHDDKRIINMGEAVVKPDDYYNNNVQFDLFLDVYEREGQLRCKLSYANPLFSHQRLDDWIGQFKYFLNEIIEKPEAHLREYQILSKEEINKLLTMGRGITSHNNQQTTVKHLAEVFNAKTKEPALWFRGTEISFGDIEKKASMMAEKLYDLGIRQSQGIGILLPRTPDLLVAIVASMKIGCPWIPLDPALPEVRLNYMLENSDAQLLISVPEIINNHNFGIRWIDPKDCYVGESNWISPYESKPWDIAYIIYTSGSSGRPKGVKMSHGSLFNFINGMAKALEWPEGSRTACITTASFDIFMLETLLCWGQGGCVVLADETEATTPNGIYELVKNGKVDCLQMTPTRLQLLATDNIMLDKVLSSVERLIVGGEGFPNHLLPLLKGHKSLRFFNVYGPTETCIWSTCKELTNSDTVTIGSPITNTNVYILDKNKQLLPEGVIGDLWIGGAGVASGYINNSELTNASFVDNPFDIGKIYSTGDLAKWNNGELECLGRNDGQVKLRGHRIELGEIEQVLRNHSDIINAAATLHEVNTNNKVLVAYYQVKDEAIKKEQVKNWLAEYLPSYMVPEILVEVFEFPQTHNGKIDRKSLKLPLMNETIDKHSNEEALENIDKIILDTCKNVLGNRTIGIHDTFFDVGANSYSIVLIQALLNDIFPGKISVADVFAYPTIALLREHIKSKDINSLNEGKDVIALPKQWFEGAGEGGRVEFTIEHNTVANLKAFGDMYKLNLSNTILALFALYLNKSLNYLEIPIWTIADKEQAALINVDFHGDGDIDKIFKSIAEKTSSITDYKKISILPVNYSSGQVRIGYGLGRDYDSRRLLRCMDLILIAEERNREVRIILEFNKKLSASTLQTQMSLFIKLLEFVIKKSVINNS